MNESLRLAAWLDANAKHMPMDEAAQMHKAAIELRYLSDQVLLMNGQILIQKNMIHTADGLITDMRKMLEAAGELPQQTPA